MHNKHKHEANHKSEQEAELHKPKRIEWGPTIFFEVASMGACCVHACGHGSDGAEMRGRTFDALKQG